MTENFPNVTEDINLQIQEAEPAPNRINLKNPQLLSIVKSLKAKHKEKILKAVTNSCLPTGMTAEFCQKPWRPEGNSTFFKS